MVPKSVLALLPGDQLITMAMAKVGATTLEASAVEEFFNHLKGSFIGSFLPESPATLVKMMVGGSLVGGPAADLIGELSGFPGARQWLQGQIDRLVASFPRANDIVSLVEKFQKEGLVPASRSEDESLGEYVATILAEREGVTIDHPMSHVAHTCPSCNFAHIVNF